MYSLMIAEDELATRRGLVNMVNWESLGFRVTADFADGKELLERLGNYSMLPDVILTDIQMIQVSGLDIAKYVADNGLPVKVVLLTGYKLFEYAQAAIENHVASYLLKPVSITNLKQVFSGLKEQLDRGLSFPAARQRAAEQLLGTDAAVLSRPNNTLGIEYLRALHTLGSPIRPVTVKREGAGHNEAAVFSGQMSQEEADQLFWQHNTTLSATAIRGYLTEGEWERMAPYLPQGGLELLRESAPELPVLARLERAILARVRTMSAEDWGRLPDAGAAEGLPNRLERAGRECRSMEEFFDLAKTKRYTHSRLRRLVLWAFLGITAADVPAVPPYIRVLGFNARGQELLREMKGRACLPILTMPVQARGLEAEGRRLFELESRCTDLYNLCRTTPRPAGEEWTRGPVRG